MARSDWALIVGAIATVISFVLLIPQIVRLLRTGRTAGVSPTWAALGTTINGVWFVYVVAEEIWIAIPSDIVATSSFGLTFFLLWRRGATVGPGLVTSAITVVVLAAIQIRFGWTAMGTTLAFSYVIQFMPSITTAWRTHTPVGLSPATWTLALAEAFAWSAYGVLIENGPFILFGAGQGLTALLVLLRYWVTRDRVRAELQGSWT